MGIKYFQILLGKTLTIYGATRAARKPPVKIDGKRKRSIFTPA